MIGIPGCTVIEARTTADTLDVLVETELRRPSRCPRCGGAVTRAGAELEDLVPSSAAGRVSRPAWRRRRWHCPAEDCPIDVFPEDDAGVVRSTSGWPRQTHGSRLRSRNLHAPLRLA